VQLAARREEVSEKRRKSLPTSYHWGSVAEREIKPKVGGNIVHREKGRAGNRVAMQREKEPRLLHWGGGRRICEKKGESFRKRGEAFKGKKTAYRHRNISTDVKGNLRT